MKYTFKMWDRVSTINGATSEQVLSDFKNTTEQIYLIIDNETNNVVAIQTESLRPYKDCSLEECAQKQVDEMNAMLINPVPVEAPTETVQTPSSEPHNQA